MPDRPRFSLEAQLAKLDAPERQAAEAKLHALRSELVARHGVDVRDDSRLAYQHATDATDLRLEDICEELALIQWLSRETDYQRMCEPFLRTLAERMREQYNLDWRAVWKVVRVYGPDILKYEYIQQMGGVPALAARPAGCAGSVA